MHFLVFRFSATLYLKTAGRRANRTNIWASGYAVNLIEILLLLSVQGQPGVIEYISDFSDFQNLVSRKWP